MRCNNSGVASRWTLRRTKLNMREAPGLAANAVVVVVVVVKVAVAVAGAGARDDEY